ncbi:hypothetical protein [Paracoccus sanguinis]|uniref:Uncharacterized protein n=3 Tax=Paracoccus sanguinis TaxID=1545044 RepID=A0A1H2WR26_9RHOB|nr:hypothetical protein [Paracoccus sanguinis]SDW83082.1 hypothetical protein SAMN05444276_102242 [Paracoccus sanguinis]
MIETPLPQRLPRLVLHVPLVDVTGGWLAGTLAGNGGRLAKAGVTIANLGFPEMLKAQRRLLWSIEDDRPQARRAALAADVARINAEVMEKAAAAGAHSVVLSHDQALGYQPYLRPPGSAPGPLYPRAAEILPALLAGIEPSRITLILSAPAGAGLMAALHAEGAGDGQLELDLDRFTAGFDPAAASSEGIAAALAAALPGAAIRLRAVEPGTDPAEIVTTLLRDFGANPDALRRVPRPATMAKAPDPQPPTPGRAPAPATATAPPPETPPLTVFFMVEPGPLEFQAHLLVASLIVNGRDRMRLTGFCRDDRIDGLHPESRAFLTVNGVSIEPLHNDFADGYPAGNKLIAAATVTAPGWALFMDTDMILVRPSRFLDEAVPGMMSACIDTVNGWSSRPEDWAAMYAAVDQPPPDRQVRLLGGQSSYPVFNAGLVMFDRRAGAGDFGRLWHDSARRIDAADNVPNKRPWLDTISIPAALARREAPLVRWLSPDWNCTTRMASDSTRVIHYHGARQLLIHGWEAAVDAILAASPSPYASLMEAAARHRDELGIDGDLLRRAMRHGVADAAAKPE